MTALRLLLNSDFTGANAFFALAEADGLLRAADVDLHYTPGRGAWSAAGRLADEDFDLAYGDLNALAELAANRGGKDDEADLPLAVWVAHQHAPSTITVPRASGVRAAADLAGKRILGHASDVALKTFPLFARAGGLAADAATIVTSPDTMRTLLQQMLDGQYDAVFGYVTTHTAALAGLAAACNWRTVPALERVFTRRFLGSVPPVTSTRK